MSSAGQNTGSESPSSDIGEFRAVKTDGSGNVTPTSGAGDEAYAYTGPQSASSTDDSVTVRYPAIGSVKCTVDGNISAISKGDKLMPKGSGSGKLRKHDSASGSRYVARALEPSSDDGDVIEVLVFANQQVTT